MDTDRTRWVAAYWLFRLVILLGRLLPTRLVYAVAEPVADACYVAFRRQRRELVANLTRVLGDPAAAKETGRRVFRHFSKYVIDFFQLPALGRSAVNRRVVFDDWDRLDAVFANGRGTIMATLHVGQWEMGAAALAAKGYPINVIAQTFDYEPMNRLVQGLRQNLGMRIIPSERAALPVLRALKRNEGVGMLFDAPLAGDETTVRFFGGRAEVSRALARVALRSGAHVVPSIVVRDEADPTKLHPVLEYDFCFTPTGNEAADVPAFCQALASAFEPLLRRYADQWYAFHDVWPLETRAAKAAKGERWKQWALAAAFHLVGRLPKKYAYLIGRFVGDAAFYARPNIRADVEDNMRHVLGPGARRALVRRAAREAFRNVCRYYADIIRLPLTRPDQMMASEITVFGFEGLKQAMAGGRGAVLATAHFGNPEMALPVSGILGLDMLVLSEPLQPPAFDSLMKRLRDFNGGHYEDVGFTGIGSALAHLRKGGCVAIACDRDVQGRGVPLRFFGEATRLPLGAVELASRTGALVVPAYCKRRIGGFDLVFEEPMPLVDTGRPKADALVNAQALLKRIEPWIRAAPGQWFVLERIWKVRIEGKAARGTAAADAKMAAGR